MKKAVSTVGRALDGFAAGAVVAGIVTLVVVALTAMTGESSTVPGLVEAEAERESDAWAVSVNFGFAGILILALAGMALRLLLGGRRRKKAP